MCSFQEKKKMARSVNGAGTGRLAINLIRNHGPNPHGCFYSENLTGLMAPEKSPAVHYDTINDTNDDIKVILKNLFI